MKKLLLLLTLSIGLATANGQTKADRQAILQVLENQRLAWNKGDLLTFMQGYAKTDSIMFVGSTGVTYGWQNTLNQYKKTYVTKSGMGTLTFGIKKVDLLSPTSAFVMGSWHLKQGKEQMNGYFTLLFKKIDGKWKCVADHSS